MHYTIVVSVSTQALSSNQHVRNQVYLNQAQTLSKSYLYIRNSLKPTYISQRTHGRMCLHDANADTAYDEHTRFNDFSLRTQLGTRKILGVYSYLKLKVHPTVWFF